MHSRTNRRSRIRIHSRMISCRSRSRTRNLTIATITLRGGHIRVVRTRVYYHQY